MAYHPTDISLRERYCGHALNLKAKNTPYNKDIFQVGVAAHAILEHLGKACNEADEPIPYEQAVQVAEQTTIELASQGRAYDGIPEPPMKIKQALEGKALALKHYVYNPLPPDGLYEEHFAYNEAWERVDYNDTSAVFRTILDFILIETVTDEDGDTYTTAIVRDYKSSWYIDKDMLDNVQRRAQAVCVWLANQVDLLKMQVFSLRSGQCLERLIYTQTEQETLEQWQNDIGTAVKIMAQKQVASPGVSCIGCPYAYCCSYVSELATHGKHTIRKYAAATAISKALDKSVRALTKESPYRDANGLVGYKQKERVSAKKDAAQTMAKIWVSNGGSLSDYIGHLSLSVTQAKRIAKLLAKQGLDADTVLNALSSKSTYSQFGIHK